MLEQLKRVRKGKASDLDFLDDKKGKNSKGKGVQDKISKKRDLKNKKFGFGGKKKGSKLNTRESTHNMDGFNNASKKSVNFKNKTFNTKKKNQRPGKSKRKNKR